MLFAIGMFIEASAAIINLAPILVCLMVVTYVPQLSLGLRNGVYAK